MAAIKAFDLRRNDKVTYLGRTRTVEEVEETHQPNDERLFMRVWFVEAHLPAFFPAESDVEVA